MRKILSLQRSEIKFPTNEIEDRGTDNNCSVLRKPAYEAIIVIIMKILLSFSSLIQAPAAVETPNQKPKSPVEDCVSTVTSQTTPTAASPVSDYRQKYQHLIGGLDCAEKTAVRMEPNKVFGYGEVFSHCCHGYLRLCPPQ